MAFLRDLFSTAAANSSIGRSRAGDLGVSEFAGSLWSGITGRNQNAMRFDLTPQAKQSLFPTSQYSQPIGPSPAGQTAPVKPTGNTSGGTTNPFQNTVNQATTYGADQTGKANQFYQDTSKYLTTNVRDAYGNVQKNLDFQLENLPNVQSRIEGNIGDWYNSSRGNIDAGRESSLGKLAMAEETTKGNTRGYLRDLGETARNVSKGVGNYIGSVGAGDSSAANQATNAIGRQYLKQQGNIYEQERQGLSQIQQQKADVENVALQAINNLDQQKSQKLQELAIYFDQTMRELNNAKNNASIEEMGQINNIESNLRTNLANRLQSIDDEVNSTKSAVTQWMDQRNLELQDYATKLSMAGQYNTAPVSAKQQAAAEAMMARLEAAGVPREQAMKRTNATIFGDPYSDIEQGLESEEDMGLEVQPKRNIPFIPFI